MDRLTYIQMKVDRMIASIDDEEIRKFTYIHIYGVSSYASLLAKKRGLDMEICAIAGMLHDIERCINPQSLHHAVKGAERAHSLLQASSLFTDDEITCIVQAIAHHSEKLTIHEPYDEVIKDSDVMAHYFFHPLQPVADKERVRLFHILEELNVK